MSSENHPMAQKQRKCQCCVRVPGRPHNRYQKHTLESLGFTVLTHPPLHKQLAVLSASQHIPSYHPETLTVVYWSQWNLWIVSQYDCVAVIIS